MNDWKEAGVPQPLATTVDLTEACNLACDYCFTHSCHNRRDISWDMIKRIMDWWIPQTNGTPQQPTEFSAWGGEPLIRWDFWKDQVVPYARKVAQRHGIAIVFGGTTNGVLFTPDKLEWMLENNSVFMVSLDGVQPSHDAHRKMPSGKGSWKLIDKNVRELLKIHPRLKLRMSVHPDTLDYFYESMLYFYEDLGAEDTAFSAVYEADWEDPATIEKLHEQLDLIVSYHVKRLREGKPVRMKQLNDAARWCFQDERQPMAACGAGRQYTGWSIDGYCYPCHRFNKHGQTTEQRATSDVTIARPSGEGFEWINQDFRRTLVNATDYHPEKCHSCEFYAGICNGNCPAVNWDLTGKVNEVTSNVCSFNLMLYEAGKELAERAREEGLMIENPDWGSGAPKRKPQSCICYNMCYAENTEFEIIHIDKQNQDMMCLCNHANYAPENENFTGRPLKEKFSLLQKTVPIIKRIFATRHLDKTKEEIELENKLLSQFFEHLQ